MFVSMLLPAIFSLSLAQADTDRALYLVELVYGKEGKDNVYQLVRVSFDRGNNLVKQVIVAKDQHFFAFGRFQLLADRYVVASSGGVIDIQTKEVIYDEKRINDAKNGVLLGIEDGKVVYRFPHAYFAFDLKTRKVEKLAQAGHWALPDEKSPDKTLSVSHDWDYDIHLHRLDGTSKVLSKDHEINYSPLSSDRGPGVPLLWLDKERILTQKKNGHLVILDLQGNAETVVEIKDAPEVVSSPGLEMDRRNRIIYQCGHVYLIDLKRKTASRLDRYALGNGFEASVEADATKRYTVYHDGKPIGSRLEWVTPYSTRTTPGTIALVTGMERDGIAVWNAKIGDWQTMKLYVESLVGWAQTGAGAKGLRAELSLTDTPHIIQVRYSNLTASDAKVNRQVLESSILALDFFDESGRQLHTIPPPTPDENQKDVVIGVGKTHIVRYDLRVFSPPLVAGRYRVQVRLDGWESEKLEYIVTAP